jgi:hypothetical protein
LVTTVWVICAAETAAVNRKIAIRFFTSNSPCGYCRDWSPWIKADYPGITGAAKVALVWALYLQRGGEDRLE